MNTTVAKCPECKGGWTLVELVTWVQELTMSYDAFAKCPRCGIETVWTKEGEIGLRSEVKEVEVLPRWYGRRGEPEPVICACGCGETFLTTHADKFYKNATHWKRGQRKGITVDSTKRPMSYSRVKDKR